MFRYKRGLIFFGLFAGLIFSANKFAIGVEEKLFAYVVSKDRRIYKIDLNKNEVVFKSEKIEEMGKPTAIDINKERGKLYVASERGHWQEKYSPIVVLDIKELPVKLINNFDLIVEETNSPFVGVSAVFEVNVWPDGKKLFLGYGHPKYNRGTTVVDSTTGEILSLLNFKIHLKEIDFSPDQTKISKIWDKGHAIYDLVKNEQISLKKGEEIFKNGVGLSPPWTKVTLPLYMVVDYKYLKAINRDNGKIISEIDLEKITNGLNSSARYPLIYDKGTKVIMSMIGINQQGYIVVIDLENKKVISKIAVGEYPTNVVLSR